MQCFGLKRMTARRGSTSDETPSAGISYAHNTCQN